MDSSHISLFLAGPIEESKSDQKKALYEELLSYPQLEDLRWTPLIKEDSDLINWVSSKRNLLPEQRRNLADILTYVSVFRRFIHECRSDYLVFLYDDATLEDSFSDCFNATGDFTLDTDAHGNVKAFRASYRFVLRCLSILDSCNLDPDISPWSLSHGTLSENPWVSRPSSIDAPTSLEGPSHNPSGVYRVFPSISPEIVTWMSYENPYLEVDEQELIRFLCHLKALRESSLDQADSAVFLEDGWHVIPGFDERIDDVLDELPAETEVLFLTHQVDDWDRIQFQPLDSDDDNESVFLPEERQHLFCLIEKSQRHDLLGYWMTRGWTESLLGRYYKPFRFYSEIPSLDLLLPRIISCTLMLNQPMVYRKDTPDYESYFSYYGY